MRESALARLKDSPAADRAKEEVERYLMAQGERLLTGAGRAMGRSTPHLHTMADGAGPGLKAPALDGARGMAKGPSPLRSVVGAGAQARTKAASGVRGRLAGHGGTPGRPTAILESVDVGVPVTDADTQWTRYREFPEFAGAVPSAEAVDDTTGEWHAKIDWSHGGWTAHITETTQQVPDERIAWTSEEEEREEGHPVEADDGTEPARPRGRRGSRRSA